MRVILAVLFAALASVAALAEDAPLTALRTGDDTRGWEAVGRLNFGASGFCTGALIAPDLVLTAAHCLYDKETGDAFTPDEIEFLAGWRDGRAAAYRGVRRALAHPDYIYEGPDKIDRVAFDLALLQLDQPIRLPSIRPFATARQPADGDEVGVVSYALDRSEAPSLQRACQVLGQQGGVLVLSCSVDFGSSGSPVFSFEGGEPRIVSVVSAKAELEDQKVALGTLMQEPLAELLAVWRGGAPVASALSGATPRAGAGGAKFLKP
jgi:V8-like Glu-specific endopeptidase